ncbi:outer membrane protein [Labrys wisconsinensis]|uniref:Outer membrane immunogenic protein n=1 Tax=Labrys wisconsinensis TaxID=425677 RepID=A0ABU0JNK5_9HYPH|nr:outer membrane protein [Labrys wisconsinensis]MDQ0474869.1 outer membrane immunogenic protein [Labrys wisconsinensis]
MNIRNSLKIGTAALALIGSVAVARAADLAAAPVEPVAPIPYAFSWTGFYVGANIGYGFGGDDRVGVRNNLGVVVPNFAKFEPDGIFGGVQAGYNYQWGNFVFGLEGDFQGAGIDDKFNGVNAGGVTWSGKSNLDWFGTIRPRAGFAWDRFLIYGTGGVAFGGIDYRVSGIDGGGNTVDMKKNDTQVGWTAGAGLEYAITDNWTAKLEYQYINFGKEKITAAVVPPNGIDVSTNETVQTHTVRLGVNYKF